MSTSYFMLLYHLKKRYRMKIDKQLLKEAKQLISKTNNYSIAHLQRKLQIGYNCAAVIMEIIKKGHKQQVRLYSKKKKRFRCV